MLSRARTFLSLVVAVAVVTGVCQAVAFIEAPRAARALASAAQGTGGQFVAAQGRVLDTRNASVGGYSTPMAAAQWRKVQIGGRAGVPADGVAAVAVTFTVVGQQAGGRLRRC